MIGRNDSCWCGSGKKWKKCHFPKENLSLQQLYWKKHQIVLKSPEQIEKIHAACQVTMRILDELCKAAQPGVTTNALNELAEKLHKEAGVIAAPLGYGSPPFPKSICTSLNEVVCHGIPNDLPLREGDIMNIDVSCILEGYYGDCSRMVQIGKVSSEAKKVCDTSYEALMAAIAVCKPGAEICSIGEAICQVAEKNNCSVVHQFVGHGVGLDFHEPPQIAHHRNRNKIPMAPGMTFTIEPMINLGVADCEIDTDNEWEARTVDGKLSAQVEHTILITDSGHEILTLLEN